MQCGRPITCNSLPLATRILAVYWRYGPLWARERLAAFVCGLSRDAFAMVPLYPGTVKAVVDLADPICMFPISYAMMPGEAFNNAWYGFIGEGETVIDVGANFGYYSLLAAERVGPSGTVVSIEPQAQPAALLRHSAQLNGFSQITVAETALGCDEGVQTLFCPLHRQSGIATLREDEAWLLKHEHRSVRVPICRIDSIVSEMQLGPVAAVKVDVEGAELDVLRGGSSLFSGTDAPAIFLESPLARPGSDREAASQLFDLLEAWEYSIFALADSGDLHVTSPADFAKGHDVIAIKAAHEKRIAPLLTAMLP